MPNLSSAVAGFLDFNGDTSRRLPRDPIPYVALHPVDVSRYTVMQVVLTPELKDSVVFNPRTGYSQSPAAYIY